MLIKNLDELKINKTVIGVCCPACGGDLQPVENAHKHIWRNKIITLITRRASGDFKCSNCSKEVSIFWD